jgi:hypothetical protein
MPSDGPDQPALFRLDLREGGNVWLVPLAGGDRHGLGPVAPAATLLADWLGRRGDEADLVVTSPGAPFKIEGPDEEGCVWACSADGRAVWCQNLGPADPTAAEIECFLGEIDFGDAVPDLG